MTPVDYFIIFGVASSMALGFRDGFFKKLYGILAFWGGLILAVKFMDPFSETILEWFDFSMEVCMILAFFIIFLLTVVAGNLLYRWFGSGSSEMLQIRTRVAGALLGGGQGLVAISLLLIMFNLLEIPSEEEQKESTLYKETIRVAPTVFDYSTQWMPSSQQFFEVIKSKIERFNIPR